MSHLPDPPAEVPADADMMKLAPVFAAKVFQVLHEMERQGYDPVVSEAFRSDERQRFLYGFGRDYDDGRGIVTNADDGRKSWHRFGLAVDIISTSRQWDAHPGFWIALRDSAEAVGLTSGARWTHPDRPHVQHFCPGMHVTPSDHAWELLQSQGVEAVWKEVHADAWEQAA